jgi:uncharacterized protein YbjT (DUF2867 family)
MTLPGKPPILVIGGTGRIGRLVVGELLDGGVPVRVLTRKPEAARLPPPVEVVRGDLTVPESLDTALRGLGAVFLVWTVPPATVSAVIERLAGHVRRVVLLASPHQTAHPFFRQPNPMAALHAGLERQIATAGLESTILRPGMFASNALGWWAPSIRRGSAVRWPYASVETAPIDDRDIAAVAARTLCDDRYVGGDYVLTGPEALTQAAQVAAIAAAIGRSIQFEELSPDEFRREMTGVWPGPVVDMLLAAWGAAVGVPAFMTSNVQDILGSSPRTFGQWASDHAAAFAGQL